MKRILVIFTHLKLWVAEARLPKLDNLAVKGLICGDRPHPLSPNDALKLHFTSLKTYLNCPTTKSFRTKIETGSTVHGTFLSFLNHIKSSPSTTNRELRQQLAACSGWR